MAIPAVDLRLIQGKRRAPLFDDFGPRVRGNLVCRWLVAYEGSLLPGSRLRRLLSGRLRGELLGLRYRRLVTRGLGGSAFLLPGRRLRRLHGGARLRGTADQNCRDDDTEDP